MLEVGIGTPETMPHVKGYKSGASLRMWADYFRYSWVLGLDVNPDAVAAIEPGATTGWLCDATKPLETDFGGKFDLIIDDGSHKPEDQLAAFHNLYPLLYDGGLYIIEDVERYALEQNLLSPHLPEHTVIQHHHGKEVGRCILIRG